jgi:hypothetical protein
MWALFGPEVARTALRSYDRGDMQTFPDRTGPKASWPETCAASVPVGTPVYGFDLVGYRHSAMPTGHGNRHELGGLTDATFALIPNI